MQAEVLKKDREKEIGLFEKERKRGRKRERDILRLKSLQYRKNGKRERKTKR